MFTPTDLTIYLTIIEALAFICSTLEIEIVISNRCLKIKLKRRGKK